MLESVLDTYEALKTKLQMRKKVHQIKEWHEVLEKPQELSKENGKDDIELMDFAARFSRQDTEVQLQQDTRSPETAQLGAPQRRAAVETKVEEAAKRGKSDVWNPDEKRTSGGTRWLNSMTREGLYYSGADKRSPD